MIDRQEATINAFGYSGEIIKIDLYNRSVTRLPTEYYADRFLGGRGIADKIYWDMVPTKTKAFDEDNCFICATGPLAGFTRLAGSRWTVGGKSTESIPEAYTNANVGGGWGARLKFAGYDALAVYGKSETPVYVYIHNGKVEFKDATHLWGKTTYETAESLKGELGKDVRVLTIGQAAENLVAFATVLTDENSSGSSGLGAVMGSKKLKALVVAGDKRPKAARPELLRNLADRAYQMFQGYWPSSWSTGRQSGTTQARPTACYGCVSVCTRGFYTGPDGGRYKQHCQPIDMYRRPAMRYYNEQNDALRLAIRLCDGYGLDTCVMQPMIEWLIGCHRAGILGDEDTGLPMSQIGSAEFIEALARKISYREGFGDVLAQGTIKAAQQVGKGAEEQLSWSVYTRSGECKDYDPRLIITNALLLAMEPRRPISLLHDITVPYIRWLWYQEKREGSYVSTEVFRNIGEKYWGGAIAADLSTYEGKALATKKIQDRTFAKESAVFCDMVWPISFVRDSETHVGDPSLEGHIVSAVTGKDLDEAGLNMIGERVFNLQRAIVTKQGWGGRKGDVLLDYLYEEPLRFTRLVRSCIVPGKDGKIISRQGEVVDREKFEQVKDEYYGLRGWDVATGLPTKATLEKLDLADVARDLKKEGFKG